ncbi:MAG: type II CAAX endopeptidase family protein [Mariniblastus sp.]|nr:type II CAAX endopeptidase family protein [Mariniblastus sp.]
MNENQNIGVNTVSSDLGGGPDEQEPSPIFNPKYVLPLTLLFEGGMVLIALSIGWFGFHAPNQPLAEIDGQLVLNSFFWGAIATIPLCGYLAFFHYCPLRALKALKEVVTNDLAPLFQRLSLVEFALIALLAGLCEELLFRWALQGGITELVGGEVGVYCGILISALIFGLCHWINHAYGITTFVMGVYFGLLMDWSGTFLVPAVAHFLFDFVALIYIAKRATSGKSHYSDSRGG